MADTKQQIQELNEWLVNNPHHPDSATVIQQKWALEKELENDNRATRNT